MMKYLKDRIQSMYDTMKQIPVEILEQDARLVLIRNQLAIILTDLEEELGEPAFTPPRHDEIYEEGMRLLAEEILPGYEGCGEGRKI